MTNSNNTQTPNPYSNLARSFVKQNGYSGNQNTKSDYRRIFFKVEQILNQPNTLTTAFGYDLLTKEYIAVRLNTVEEYANDLVTNERLSKDSALQKARHAYTGSNSREPLAAKRDKHRARFLSFDNCLLIGDINGVPLYRSHWSEMISNQENCLIFQGLSYLNVREAVRDQEGNIIRKEIAQLNTIQQIKDLELKNFTSNFKALNGALATSFKNGMPRTGYAIFQIFDTVSQKIVAEPIIFQKFKKDVAFDPNTGIEHNINIPLDPTESINAFMNDIADTDPNTFLVEKDFLRVIMPLFFDLQVNKDAFCQQNPEYLEALRNIYKRTHSGEITVRIISIHQVYIGAERKNHLVKNINKGVIKAYTKKIQDPETMQETIIRHYIPTVFALHFHRDSGNPYVAYNMLSFARSPIKPAILLEVPKDLFGFNYIPLN